MTPAGLASDPGRGSSPAPQRPCYGRLWPLLQVLRWPTAPFPRAFQSRRMPLLQDGGHHLLKPDLAALPGLPKLLETKSGRSYKV